MIDSCQQSMNTHLFSKYDIELIIINPTIHAYVFDEFYFAVDGNNFHPT